MAGHPTPGLRSIALGFAHFYLILRVVLNRDPFDFDYVPPEGEDEFRVDISKRKKEKNQPA